jgi:hypothetical protein
MKTRGQAVPQITDQPAREQRDAARKVYRAVTARFKNGNQGVQDLAEAMTMPCMAAVRFPTQDMPRTSVTVCTDQRNVSSPTVAYSSFPTGDLLIAFFGQPGRLAMIYGPITSGGTGTWYFTPSTATTIAPGLTRRVEIPASTTQTSPVGMWLDPVGVSADVPIHGQTQTVGKQDNHTYLWLNTGDVVNFSYTVTAVPTQGTIMMRVVRYQGPNSSYEDIADFTMGVNISGTGSYTHSSAAGYIAFVVDSYSASTGTTGILVGALTFNSVTTAYAGGVGWMQVSLADCDPNAAGDMNMMEEARVNGASLLATNVSSALNRQGTVLAARMRQVPFWKVTPAMLGRAAEKYQGDAIHGCYTFFEFSDTRQTFVNCNTDYAASFDLDYNDYYHFIELSCPAYATAPNSYAIKFDTLVEYKTDIGRYGKATSEYTFQDLVAARRLINSVPVWFYENPTHAKQLYGLIKRALGGAWKVGKKIAPYALNAASAANPELAPLLQALKLVL